MNIKKIAAAMAFPITRQLDYSRIAKTLIQTGTFPIPPISIVSDGSDICRECPDYPESWPCSIQIKTGWMCKYSLKSYDDDMPA